MKGIRSLIVRVVVNILFFSGSMLFCVGGRVIILFGLVNFLRGGSFDIFVVVI